MRGLIASVREIKMEDFRLQKQGSRPLTHLDILPIVNSLFYLSLVILFFDSHNIYLGDFFVIFMSVIIIH